MPCFAANLSMMCQEHVFLDCLIAAAGDGFEGVELLLPYDFDKTDIRVRLDDTGLMQALSDTSPSGWAGDERSIVSSPGREEEFKRGATAAFEYAQVLDDMCLHVMAGLLPVGVDRACHHTVYVSNIAYAAREAAGVGITIMLEPINTHDMPSFSLTHQAQAHAVCKEVGTANVKVQFNPHHAQIMEDDLSVKLKQYVDGVGRVRTAGVPDCYGPGESELYYLCLFALLDALGYSGWTGCEYWPRAGTSKGLGWPRR